MLAVNFSDQVAVDRAIFETVRKFGGVFYYMRNEIPAMFKSGGGFIINMASILVVVAFANSAGCQFRHRKLLPSRWWIFS